MFFLYLFWTLPNCGWWFIRWEICLPSSFRLTLLHYWSLLVWYDHSFKMLTKRLNLKQFKRYRDNLAIAFLNTLRPSDAYMHQQTIIGSDSGFSPGRRQPIIWTNVRILLIGPLGTNFSEILIKIHTFPFMRMHLKMLPINWWPFYLGLNVLRILTACIISVLKIDRKWKYILVFSSNNSAHCKVSCHLWSLHWKILTCANWLMSSPCLQMI